MPRRFVGPLVALGVALLVVAIPAPSRTGAVAVGEPPAGVVPMVHPSATAPASTPSCSHTTLCPFAIRTAYNLTSVVKKAATNGTGQTIVIVDACGDRHIAADLATFDTQFSLPAPPSFNVTGFGPGTTCTSRIWAEETALDVEWAHVVAPGAAIDLIVTSSPNTSTIYGAWNFSVAHHLGLQISNSWDGTGGCGNRLHTYLNAAAAAGVTVLAASGDIGSWGAGTFLKPLNPADCASVVAVGATTLTLGTHDAYVGESGWSASGGGYVGNTSEPKYQRTANITDPRGVLGKPDVAADGDPQTGVWTYNARDGWVVLGGTSVACPLWAGIVADANGLRASNGFGALTDLNRYLYVHVYGANGSSVLYPSEFHDVTTGHNSRNAGPGWDTVTGLGSFVGDALVQQLGSDRSA